MDTFLHVHRIGEARCSSLLLCCSDPTFLGCEAPCCSPAWGAAPQPLAQRQVALRNCTVGTNPAHPTGCKASAGLLSAACRSDGSSPLKTKVLLNRYTNGHRGYGRPVHKLPRRPWSPQALLLDSPLPRWARTSYISRSR